MLTPRHLNLGKRLYAVIEESGRFQPTRVINVRPFSRCPVALDQQCYVREASWFAQDTDASRTTTGAHDWSNHARSIDDFSARLKGVLVENTDAIKVIRQHDAPDTLFYVDPPYPMGSRDKFRDYRHEMTDEDHEELAAVLKSVQGRVVVSGYRSALYERLYGDWRSIEEKAYADGARPRREVLGFSP